MTQILDNLVALLSLEPIEENLFRGMSQDLGFRQLYGGQVLGQALSAASQTVEDDRHVHSMHGYFLRPGDASMPVVYQVDRARRRQLQHPPGHRDPERPADLHPEQLLPVRRGRFPPPDRDARGGWPG